MGRPGGTALRIALPAVFLIIVGILVLTTTRYSTYIKSNILKIDLHKEHPSSSQVPADQEKTSSESETPDVVGAFYHVAPTTPTAGTGIKGCVYPIVVHVTPDDHCTGALALYGSIVRNVLQQPAALQKKVCVHMTYVNKNLKTIEDMYKWPTDPNPFTNVPDCAALDNSTELNKVVPVRFQGLLPMAKPKSMKARPEWVAALNKVHSWGFDLYKRVLILDADSMVLTDLHKIFLESHTDATIAGAPDQFYDCHDRARINGGMILLKPSRYFHMISAELLQDPRQSCISSQHDWGQSEQELMNCMCGYRYSQYAPMRPEFRCDIMPVYNSVWPKSYGCSDVNLLPMRSIHFADATKPWKVAENRLDERTDTKFYKCVRDGARNGSTEALKACKGVDSKVARKLPNLRY